MLILHEHAVERKIRDMKFSAVLHGADPKEMEDKEYTVTKAKDNLMFGDPADYEKMSEEEKKALSSKMMKKFSSWAGAKKDGKSSQ
jgi:hypothetical protein